MPNILTANRSDLSIDGVVAEGVQSISFRETRAQLDIMAIGTDERIDIAYGQRQVRGTIVVASSNDMLAQHMENKTKFQIVANLKKETGISNSSQVVSFDDCFLHEQSFGMAANGIATTTYEFSSTVVRFE